MAKFGWGKNRPNWPIFGKNRANARFWILGPWRAPETFEGLRFSAAKRKSSGFSKIFASENFYGRLMIDRSAFGRRRIWLRAVAHRSGFLWGPGSFCWRRAFLALRAKNGQNLRLRLDFVAAGSSTTNLARWGQICRCSKEFLKILGIFKNFAAQNFYGRLIIDRRPTAAEFLTLRLDKLHIGMPWPP